MLEVTFDLKKMNMEAEKFYSLTRLDLEKHMRDKKFVFFFQIFHNANISYL
jgi:hypothetical protein